MSLSFDLLEVMLSRK